MRRIPIVGGGLLIAAVVAFGLLSVVIFDGGRRSGVSARSFASQKSVAPDSGEKITVSSRRGEPVRSEEGHRLPLAKAAAEQASKDGGDQEEVELVDQVIGELLAELKTAVRDKDKRRLRGLMKQILEKCTPRTGMFAKAAGVSSARRRILEALKEELGEGGPAVVEQIIDFVNDPEPEVADLAKSMLFDSLHDLSLGDYKRAEIVTAAAEELTDRSSIDRLYREFVKFRPSVAVQTAIQIGTTGTDAAKDGLSAVLGNIVSDGSVNSVDKLRDYLKDVSTADMDPENADEIFGPIILEQ